MHAIFVIISNAMQCTVAAASPAGTTPSPLAPVGRTGQACKRTPEDMEDSVAEEPDLDALESALQDAYAKLEAVAVSLDAIAKAAGFNVDAVSHAARSTAVSPAELSEEEESD